MDSRGVDFHILLFYLMSWLRLATNPGQRAWGLRSCSNVSNTKAVFSGPGKRQPPRWYAFSRPRSVLMLLSLRKSCVGRANHRSAWPNGSTAKISTILRTKAYKPTSRASLAQNEGRAASVRSVGIDTSPGVEYGLVKYVAFKAIEM